MSRGGRFSPGRSALSLCLLAPLGLAASAEPVSRTDETIFDLQALKTRGVDPKVAEWFRHSPKFMPGRTPVMLAVNGRGMGSVQVIFDERGDLCADADFLGKAELLIPGELNEGAACTDLKSIWPQAELTLDPAEGRVSLVVPPYAVDSTARVASNWHHGGVAGILNYDAQYMDALEADSGTRFMQLGSEIGLNFSDWIVRSQQTWSRLNGVSSVQHQAAYAQRSFVDSKQVLQLGQISLSNSLLGAGQVLGFQVFPETALLGKSGPGLVEGIADSQSVVEVSQSGVLVHSTTVPAGPFRLQGFQLLNTRSDLSVKLTGSDGSVRQFIVPASALLLNGNAIEPGLSYGLGRVYQDGDNEEPVIGTVGNGWVLTPHNTLNMGVMGSSCYNALAANLYSHPFDATLLSLQTTLSRESNHDESGVSAVATMSYQLSERVEASIIVSQQSKGYRELSDALQNEPLDNDDNIRNQFGVGISWNEETLGNLSLSVSQSVSFSSSRANYVRGGWSRQFGDVYLGASLEHDTGMENSAGDTRFYVNLSVPFGKGRNFSSYFNSSDTQRRAGMRYSEHLSQDRGWSISGERDLKTNQSSSSAYVDMVTPYSQLNGSVSHDTESTNLSARASGGIVAHSDGLTLSPYRIGETFGVANVGEEAGVMLDTPAGPTWTNGNGYAVLPLLSSYSRSSIQVNTRTLAKNVDINNAWHEIEAARGSVNYISFDVVRTRRFLVDVVDGTGKPLPHSAGVFNRSGGFITVIGDKGRAFISDVSYGNEFDVQVSGKTVCSFAVTLPETTKPNSLYETAKAVCH